MIQTTTPAILMTYLIDFHLDGSKTIKSEAQEMTQKEVVGQLKKDLAELEMLHQDDPEADILTAYQESIQDLQEMTEEDFESLKAEIIQPNQVSAEEEAQALDDFLKVAAQAD